MKTFSIFVVEENARTEPARNVARQASSYEHNGVREDRLRLVLEFLGENAPVIQAASGIADAFEGLARAYRAVNEPRPRRIRRR